MQFMGTGLSLSALRGHRPAFVGTVVAALFAAIVVSASATVLIATGGDGVSAQARRTMTANSVGDTAVVLLMVSIYMSIFVVASTMGTAVVQQHRELALVRAVGARPRQVRRAVAAQALAASVPAALVGAVLGSALSRLWFDAMVTHGLIPQGVPFGFTWLVLPICVGVAVVTSTAAAMLSSLRFSLLRPARALDEATAGRRGLGRVRAPLGVIAVAGGLFLSVLLSRQDAEEAGQAAFFVLILFCVGVGLLGPRLVGPAARIVSAPFGRFGVTAQLAALNVRSQPRRFSAAVVPLVLATGFGLIKIMTLATAQHRTGSAGSPGDVWLEYLGTALYTGFAAIAAANTLAMISFERRRDIALLRVVGTSPSQVRAMAVWEALIVAATALVLGTAIALLTLAPMLGTAYGSPFPYVPWQLPPGAVAGTAALTVLATGIPVHTALRRPAV